MNSHQFHIAILARINSLFQYSVVYMQETYLLIPFNYVQKKLHNNADFGHCATTKGFIKSWSWSTNKCLQTTV